MRLIRFGDAGKEKPGISLDDNVRKDLSNHFNDWDREFFKNNGLENLEKLKPDFNNLPDIPVYERWGSCIARPGKVICVGLNYVDHAEESGMAIPEEPIIFQKGANTVVGPYDNIIIPRKSEKTDWEVELGMVISKNASYLNSADEAKDYIAGYCIVNDVSERSFQLERGGQWTKGKSCDNFSPTGPFLVTQDEVKDVHNLSMSLSVNSKQMQKGSTRLMIFNVYYIVHYLSQFMTLEAGDLILTGTPPGVGLGMKPPTYLKDGDIVELAIEALGAQRQVCIQSR